MVTCELWVGELSDSATTAASMNESSVENLGCQLIASICYATGSDILKYKAQLANYYFRAEVQIQHTFIKSRACISQTGTWCQQEPFVTWTQMQQERGQCPSLGKPGLEKLGARKCFQLRFLGWRDNFPRERPVCTNQKLRVALLYDAQLGSISHGERAEQLLKDMFVQPYKPWNVQPGEGKGVWNQCSSVSPSWLQLPVPGTARRTFLPSKARRPSTEQQQTVQPQQPNS